MKRRCPRCGKFARALEIHHDPPRCAGGTDEDTVQLCFKCYKIVHSIRGDWAEWGRRGGKRTAANPENWQRNLKQFRTQN